MSLINDALRRARQAQNEKPPPQPAPVFRPVDPESQPAKAGPGFLVLLALGMAGLLALLLVWQLSGRNGSSTKAQPPSLSVAARPITSPDSGAAPPAEPLAQRPASVSRSETARNSLVASPDPTAASTSAASASNTNALPTLSEPAQTNGLLAVAEPAPPPLKLQSIVFNPKRPSSMINGKIMFVGDKIRDLRVTVIRPNEVILAGPGRTNILSLEP
jgi:hypothetical protein